MQPSGFVDKDPEPAEWVYLTVDTDDTCSVCGKPIRAWQAVGRVGGQVFHAKCYGKSEKPAA